MHIGIDARLPYYQRGGISQYVIQLVNKLSQVDLDNDYTIFHSRKDHQTYFPARAENFRRASLWTPCHHRFERWTLGLELLRGRQLDVLHSPDFIPPAFGASRRIITVHDLNFIHYPEFLTADSRRYYSGQIEWAVKEADHIVADSTATKRDLQEQFTLDSAKITTIHLAANPVFRRRAQSETVLATLARFGLSPGFILFVGTLSPRKNVTFLVDVYARLLNETNHEGPLVLVGSQGWLSGEVFDSIAAHGLQRHVQHLSAVPDGQLAHLYQAAAVLALPSWYEGFGLPPLEAMHSGCPVVVSNRASLPEVVGQAGILLDPADADGWFDSLRNVLQRKTLRQTMIKAGYEQAARFSWEKTAAQVLSVYDAAK